MNELNHLVDRMEPDEAMSAITAAVKRIFPYISEKSRLAFLYAFTGEAHPDSGTGLVHRWLATCMDEGVDPTQMCQSLVNKVAQSEQLQAVTDPEVLVLFEDWLEELETEVIATARKTDTRDASGLARELGLSAAGAAFLITKLERDGKL